MKVKLYSFFNFGATWGEWWTLSSSRCTSGKVPFPIMQEVAWVPEPVWKGVKILVPIKVQTLNPSLQLLFNVSHITGLNFKIIIQRRKLHKRMFLCSHRGATRMLSGFIWLRVRSIEGFCESGIEGEIECFQCGVAEFSTSWTWRGVDWFSWTFRRIFCLYIYGTNSPITNGLRRHSC